MRTGPVIFILALALAACGGHEAELTSDPAPPAAGVDREQAHSVPRAELRGRPMWVFDSSDVMLATSDAVIEGRVINRTRGETVEPFVLEVIEIEVTETFHGDVGNTVRLTRPGWHSETGQEIAYVDEPAIKEGDVGSFFLRATGTDGFILIAPQGIFIRDGDRVRGTGRGDVVSRGIEGQRWGTLRETLREARDDFARGEIEAQKPGHELDNSD